MNISEKARRQILDNFIIIGECFGTNGRAVDFVNRVAQLTCLVGALTFKRLSQDMWSAYASL